MTMWLKQSTAVTVKVGPFVDSTDGVTAETALTISQADIRLSKNGGNIAQSNNAAGATHDELGYYDIPLDTTDTNTLGTLKLLVSESGALPVWQDFMVVPANVWDSLFGADKLQVHADEITAGLITATAIDTDAITAAKIAADAIGASELAADAVAEIQSGLATAAALATVDGIVDNILVDTAEIGAAGAGLTAVPWNTAWDAEVQSEVTDALNAYDPPTKAELDSELAALNDPTAAAIADAVWEEAIVDHSGTAGSTAEALDGATAPSAADVADAVWDEAIAGHLGAGSTGEALNAAGGAGDPWVTALPGSYTGSQAGKILADVLADTNELQTDDVPGLIAALNDLDAAGVRTAVGLASANLDTQLGDLPTAAENADAVWDEAKAGHVAAGSFGEEVQAHALSSEVSALNDLSAAEVNAEVVDVIRTDVIPDSVPADGSRPTVAQALLMIARFLMEKGVSGTTVTVNKEDGATSSMTFTLDDATNPTSITRAS